MSNRTEILQREREFSSWAAGAAVCECVLLAHILATLCRWWQSSFFFPHSLLLLKRSVSSLSMGSSPGYCSSATMAAAAGVLRRRFLRSMCEAISIFPSSSMNTLCVQILACFQEGSTAAHSTNALNAETSSKLWNRTSGHWQVRLLQLQIPTIYKRKKTN